MKLQLTATEALALENALYTAIDSGSLSNSEEAQTEALLHTVQEMQQLQRIATRNSGRA